MCGSIGSSVLKKALKPSLGGHLGHLHRGRIEFHNAKKRDRIDKRTAEELADENASQDTANLELAAMRRRRRLSSLLVGGRSVLGAASGRGAASGSGAGGGGSGAGSVMGRSGGGAYGQPRPAYGGALP
jgi:hypothetical protein